MLSDPRDMARLKEAFRIGVRAMTAARQAGVVVDVFPSGYSPRIRELTRPSTRNAAITAVAASLMDRSDTIRRKVMTYAVGVLNIPPRRLPTTTRCWRRICASGSTGRGIRAGRVGWAIRRTAWR